MRGVEEIKYKQKTIAVVFRRFIPVDGVCFFTPSENPFQIGIHQRRKGTHLSPHIHKIAKPLIIDTIQEVLLVMKGRIRITLYSKMGKVVVKKILFPQDSILLMGEGHGVEFLDEAKIFEVKQGPYPGTTHAKIYFRKE